MAIRSSRIMFLVWKHMERERQPPLLVDIESRPKLIVITGYNISGWYELTVSLKDREQSQSTDHCILWSIRSHSSILSPSPCTVQSYAKARLFWTEKMHMLPPSQWSPLDDLDTFDHAHTIQCYPFGYCLPLLARIASPLQSQDCLSCTFEISLPLTL